MNRWEWPKIWHLLCGPIQVMQSISLLIHLLCIWHTHQRLNPIWSLTRWGHFLFPAQINIWTVTSMELQVQIQFSDCIIWTLDRRKKMTRVWKLVWFPCERGTLISVMAHSSLNQNEVGRSWNTERLLQKKLGIQLHSMFWHKSIMSLDKVLVKRHDILAFLRSLIYSFQSCSSF